MAEPLSELRDPLMIERDIGVGLFWNPYVDGSNVDVQVVDSTVILRGWVPNKRAYDAIIEG